MEGGGGGGGWQTLKTLNERIDVRTAAIHAKEKEEPIFEALGGSGSLVSMQRVLQAAQEAAQAPVPSAPGVRSALSAPTLKHALGSAGSWAEARAALLRREPPRVRPELREPNPLVAPPMLVRCAHCHRVLLARAFSSHMQDCEVAWLADEPASAPSHRVSQELSPPPTLLSSSAVAVWMGSGEGSVGLSSGAHMTASAASSMMATEGLGAANPLADKILRLSESLMRRPPRPLAVHDVYTRNRLGVLSNLFMPRPRADPRANFHAMPATAHHPPHYHPAAAQGSPSGWAPGGGPGGVHGVALSSAVRAAATTVPAPGGPVSSALLSSTAPEKSAKRRKQSALSLTPAPPSKRTVPLPLNPS